MTSTPLPYPQGAAAQIWRSGVTLYRLGLGPLIASHIMILTTRGRKTGLLRHTPIEYARDGDTIYVISAWGERADWYRNLQAHPHATLQIGNWHFAAKARFLTGREEIEEMLAVYRRANPALDQFAKALVGVDLTNVDDIAKLKAIRFTPSGFPPEAGVPTDLTWVWFIVIPLAFALARRLMGHKRRVKSAPSAEAPAPAP
jgi:deazaflavin-dependent oxidoreductase (nitroreductase family)